jgi:hypothetical protein
MINWIKRDFITVREALGYLVKKEVPMGIAVLYYVILGIITLPLALILWPIYKIYTKILIWKIKRGI